ncbi:MAG: ankyrin repeat domain-containing protein [Nitrosomonas sp.]|uniref:ankyrin repeat domain-containing protein n=1 Tax=Nitrosomonas sp. TaxID=42353 RepID=UPI00273697E7|nr:ankyrin repeat domain-containing protein [Nitrosomonas sp.]MDP3279769.1 ankyrin repeat domain-containing protein [Nitrosomonas sp.]
MTIELAFGTFKTYGKGGLFFLYPETALILATSGHHLEIVKMLVQKGADVNKSDGGGSPLFYACLLHDEKIASFLSGAGAKMHGNQDSIARLRLDKALPLVCR